jgi:hypothetical protein
MSGHFRGNWSTTSNSDQHQINHPQSYQSNQYQTNQYQTETETDQPSHPTKFQPGIHQYDRVCRVDPATRQIVDGYTQMVVDRVDSGWSCHLMTFPFSQLPGPRGAVIQAMKDELYRVYSTFVTRTNRKPRTASPDDLPILIGIADLQVYKRVSTSSPLVLCNGGLHLHGLLLVPPETRLEIPVQEHFRRYQDMYLGKRRLIRALDVRPVTETPERVVDYVFKTILRGRISEDEGILILPRARDEITPAGELESVH